jgi:hypothetical protein
MYLFETPAAMAPVAPMQVKTKVVPSVTSFLTIDIFPPISVAVSAVAKRLVQGIPGLCKLLIRYVFAKLRQ